MVLHHQKTIKGESESPFKILQLDEKSFQRNEHTHHIKSPTSYVLYIVRSISKNAKIK